MLNIIRALFVPVLILQCFCQTTFAVSKFHFSFEELNQNLTEFSHSSHLKDKEEREFSWNSSVAAFREPVLESFNAGLSSFFKEIPSDTPIVEIGSGSTYSLPGDQIIRLQPNKSDLSGLSHLKGVFPITIQEFLNVISGIPEKKVPVYFALNVFDTIPEKERNSVLELIAKSQDSGDRLIIASDLTPFLPTIVSEIIEENPNGFVYPYFPIPDDNAEKEKYSRFSAVFIPRELALTQGLRPIDASIFEKMLTSELQIRNKIHSGGFFEVSGFSIGIAQMKRRYDLQAITLEDYFANKMKNILEKNYNVRVSYQATFKKTDSRSYIEDHPGITEAIVYKSVSSGEVSNVRQWSCSDPRFLSQVTARGISFPAEYTDESLRSDQKILLGAEFLVIQAIRK